MNDVVPGPSAAAFDVLGRLAWLVAAVLFVVAAALTSIPITGVALLTVAAAVGLGVRSSRITRQERELGYSTIFDFPGFASRHPRTKQLLRDADTEPVSSGRRSIFRSMLSVKPGTLLAKRLEEDDRP